MENEGGREIVKMRGQEMREKANENEGDEEGGGRRRRIRRRR